MTKFGFAVETVKDNEEEDDSSDLPKTTMVSGEVEWARSGTIYSPRSRADVEKLMPPGVYSYGATPFGWFLKRESDDFEFSFKVYDASESIINRIVKHWSATSTNLGVLMNGLRGAGKTMTAQLLANRLIKDKHLPVLVIRSPIPLEEVLGVMHQDMVVIFDEFEKSHNDKQQQALLSTIDGMSRSQFRRLFIFTTNSTALNENFKDRPSRIHYQFEFARVAPEVIEGLISDSLPERLQHLRNEIVDFLDTRHICTIDIVKAVIAEVKTFEESPRVFEHMLNVSKGEPPAYRIVVVDENGIEQEVYEDYFKPSLETGSQKSLLLGGNKRAIEDFIAGSEAVLITATSWKGVLCVNLLEKCVQADTWLVHLSVPFDKTPYAEYSCCYRNPSLRLFRDEMPAGWSLPAPKKVEESDDLAQQVRRAYDKAIHSNTLFGTGQRQIFRVRIMANRNRPTSHHKSKYFGPDEED